MNVAINVLKKALDDPRLDGLTCISPSESSVLARIVTTLPTDAYISEWRYGIGEIKYVYHVHTNGIIPQLKDLFEKGIRGGHPKLTALYSKEELEDIIKQYQVGSGLKLNNA